MGETTRLAVTGQAASLEHEVLDPDIRAFVLTVANDAAPTDDDWIKAIATVVSKRAVAEWSDDDRKRFDFELRPKIAAFHRLLALHAEQRAKDDAGFDAIRVTFTRPDGREDYRLATLDEKERAIAESALQSVVADLAQVMGSQTRAQQALLAVLGDQILPVVTATSDTGITDITAKSTKHG